MHELRAPVAGTVVEVIVDEGQMVAEEDLIAVIDEGELQIAVLTDVPGVVRELYVVVGGHVTPSSVVARIDES